MNSWFTVKVKYTKQLDDGTFKRVSEPYLLAAMTFTDAEARIYGELGALIRGEFLVTGIARTDIHDIFHYEDSDLWWKVVIKFESGDGGEEGRKAKKVKQTFLVTAHNEIEAAQRMRESLGGMLIDFQITNVSVSPIVDVFPFGDDEEDRTAVEFEKQVKKEVAEHVMGTRTVFTQEGDDERFEEEDLTAIALREGFTLFDENSTVFPDDGESVMVIYENGFQDESVFWSKEEGFDAQSEPHHIAVVAWKRLSDETDKQPNSSADHKPAEGICDKE